MRRFSILALILALAACQLALPGARSSRAVKPVAGAAIVGDAITVTSLDGTAVAMPADKPPVDAKTPLDGKPAAVTEPKAEPKTTHDPAIKPELEAPPPPPQSPEEIACARKGGTYSSAGSSGGKACVKPTRDGGKRCRKESDCEGVCLARSNTCSPIAPMFGCNDILQNDGRQVTLCID